MTADTKVMAARADVEAARANLVASIEQAKSRLSPRAIAGEAVDGMKAKAGALAIEGVDAARRRPLATAAVAAAIGLFFARKPIARAIGRMADDDDATAAAPAS